MRLPLRTLRLLPFALLALSLPITALATWPHDPAAGLPIGAVRPALQYLPKAVSDDAGGAIVLWQDERSTKSGVDIYAQRIDAQGQVLWTVDGVVGISASGTQENVSAIPDGTHGVILCWEDSRSGNRDIYAQRLNGSGARQWTPLGVAVCTAANDQSVARIASDYAGGALIAWQDYRNGNPDIYAQRLDGSGNALWRPNGAVACSLAGSQQSPAVAPDMLGGAYVAWSDLRSGGGDIYAQRLGATGGPVWTPNGLVVCDAATLQANPVGVSDGGQAAIFAWEDRRNGAGDIYAQKMGTAGTIQWAADDVPLRVATGYASSLVATHDGLGGMFLTWNDGRSGIDGDAYAQWLSHEGTAQWTANGVRLCSAVNDQVPEAIAPDGLGGMIVSWTDWRLGAFEWDVYAQRLNAAGAVQWTAGGVRVGGGTQGQHLSTLVPDGAGGAFVANVDQRLDALGDILAQRVERFGHLGDPAPAITRVADVPNDQGGQVQVEWTASYLDTFPGLSVAQYTVWRRVPNPAPSLLAGFAHAGAGPARAADGRVLRTSAQGTQAVYWQMIGTLPARTLPGYSYVATTTSDSLPGSNPYTSFMVMAEEAGGVPFWMSAADSGYSVDDMAPPMPAPFTGRYAQGGTRLDWGESAAPDLAGYRLHRGGSAGFVPDLSNLISAQPTTGYNDWTGTPNYYKLCAVDIHGNISPYALLTPEGTVDVPTAPLPRELALSAPAPNPLRGSTTLRLALPRAAQVTLAVYDQQGRRVRALVAGAQVAGEHAIVWDGRDDGGRGVASGIYFVRCEVEGRTFTRRVAALR